MNILILTACDTLYFMIYVIDSKNIFFLTASLFFPILLDNNLYLHGMHGQKS